MKSKKVRLQIHLSTFIALVVLLGIFVGANISPRLEGSVISLPTTGLIPEHQIAGYVRGWPFIAYKAFYPSNEPGSAYSYEPYVWNWGNVVMNGLICATSIILVYVVLERRATHSLESVSAVPAKEVVKPVAAVPAQELVKPPEDPNEPKP